MKRLLLSLFAIASLARADHGLDFMRLQDTSVPKPGHGVLYGNFSWDRESSSDTFETEPALYFGLTEGIGFGLITAFEDEGAGWEYSSVTPYALVNLLPADSKVFKVALWAGYQFADDGSAESLQSMAYDSSGQSLGSMSRRNSTDHAEEHRHSSPNKSKPASSSHSHKSANKKPASVAGRSRHTGGGGTGSGPDAPTTGGHDHPTSSAPATSSPVPKSSKHTKDDHDDREHTESKPAEEEHEHTAHDHASGIHSHGVSGLRARLIIEANISESNKIVANLINVTPDDGKAAWGYAIGFRHAFNHDVAMSLEAIGDFDVEMQHQVLLAGHFSPAHWATVRVGAAVGLTEASPDFTLQTGLVLRF
ncbi:MAG: hypothetical protein JNJ83_07430 [Verrucomicrobiaceae bacterium]|nr:hypothetical protein [Verrucomicrobiaceae bacterium]